MNPTISMLFLSNWISLFEIFVPMTNAHDEEKCYSCSSANFENRWPKNKNSSLLYLRNFAMISNESCDKVRSAMPTVPCPNSVCVKFVVQGSLANRAACSSSLNPIIVRDCWSRVLSSSNSSLQLKPPSTNPVKLVPLPGQEKIIGHIFTCSGYLCNSADDKSSSLLSLLFFFITPISLVKLIV